MNNVQSLFPVEPEFHSNFNKFLLKLHKKYVNFWNFILAPLIKFEDWFAGNTQFFILSDEKQIEALSGNKN